MSVTKAQLIDGKVATVQFTGGSAAAPSITFSGDTSTGIYSPGSSQVAISTGGSGRLLINATGEILAGTSTSVDGNWKVQANAGASGLTGIGVNNNGGYGVYLIYDNSARYSGAGVLRNIANSPLAFETNNTERLRITAAGLVGVGTSTPGALLHVSGGRTYLGSSDGYELAFARTGNYFYWYNDGGNLTGKLSLTTSAGAGGGEIITFTQDTKRVGIGNSAPSAKLDLAGGYYRGVNGTSITYLGDGSSLVSGASASSTAIRFDGDTLLFAANSAAKMTLTSGGALGIGTSSPGAQLEVRRGDAHAVGLFTQTNASFNCDVAFDHSSAAGTFLASRRSSGDFWLYQSGAYNIVLSTNSVERARLDGSGNFLFGRTVTGLTTVGAGFVKNSGGGYFEMVQGNNGVACLYLSQNYNSGTQTAVDLRYNNTQVGTINVSSTATSYNTSSDYRLKENVVPVADGITRLQQLKPSRFNFIADPDKTVDGFIAHEAQVVVPEAITGEKDAVDDEGNPIYQGIDQSKLVPLLTAALQELVAEVEILKAEVAALKAQ